MRRTIARVTGGSPPTTCPWKAYSDPETIDVLDCVRWYDAHQLQVKLGTEPPHHIIEGLDVYLRARDGMRKERDKRRETKRRAEQIKREQSRKR